MIVFAVLLAIGGEPRSQPGQRPQPLGRERLHAGQPGGVEQAAGAAARDAGAL